MGIRKLKICITE